MLKAILFFMVYNFYFPIFSSNSLIRFSYMAHCCVSLRLCSFIFETMEVMVMQITIKNKSINAKIPFVHSTMPIARRGTSRIPGKITTRSIMMPVSNQRSVYLRARLFRFKRVNRKTKYNIIATINDILKYKFMLISSQC